MTKVTVYDKVTPLFTSLLFTFFYILKSTLEFCSSVTLGFSGDKLGCVLGTAGQVLPVLGSTTQIAANEFGILVF